MPLGDGTHVEKLPERAKPIPMLVLVRMFTPGLGICGNLWGLINILAPQMTMDNFSQVVVSNGHPM